MSKEKVKGAKAATVYLPLGLYREIQRAAKLGRRSMSSQLVTIVESIIKEQGAAK